eukprot:Hpha_TRINITY_DN10169_c0_g1::TRINITY_DN10169_c0_g1_i2::g.131531::m.131531
MATNAVRLVLPAGGSRWLSIRAADTWGDVQRRAAEAARDTSGGLGLWVSTDKGATWRECQEQELPRKVGATPPEWLRLIPTARGAESRRERPSNLLRICAIGGWFAAAAALLLLPRAAAPAPAARGRGASRHRHTAVLAAPPTPSPPASVAITPKPPFNTAPLPEVRYTPLGSSPKVHSWAARPRPRRRRSTDGTKWDRKSELMAAARQGQYPTPAPPPAVAPRPATPNALGRPRVLLVQYVCFGPKRQPNCADSDLWRFIPAKLMVGPDELPPPSDQTPLPCIQYRAADVKTPRTVARKLLEAGGPKEPAFYAISAANKAAYCLRHGYGMYIAGHEAYQDEVHRARAWGVINSVRNAIKEGWDWVMYIDSDTLITEGSIRIEDIAKEIPAHCNMALTADWNGINGGIMLWRGVEASLPLVEKFWAVGSQRGFNAFHPWTFQLGISTVMNQDPAARAQVHVFPQRKFNSYPPWTPALNNPKTQQWHPGDFLIHFAGCSDQGGRNCEREIKQYVPKVSGLGCGGVADGAPDWSSHRVR